MGKRQFTTAERYGVWLAHDERCYICKKPIDFASMEVDHIIPEELEGRPREFGRVRRKLGRRKSFSVNSFANWMPSCPKCNRFKSNEVFDPSMLVQLVLQRAEKRAAKARAIAEQTAAEENITSALFRIQSAAEHGHLPQNVYRFLEWIVRYQEALRSANRSGKPVNLSADVKMKKVKGVFQFAGNPAIVAPDFSTRMPVAFLRPHPCPNCGSVDGTQ